jgi:putative ABC transport system permease protein
MKPLRPPKLATWLFKKCLNKEDIGHRLGDLEEVFQLIGNEYGGFYAWRWYWEEVLKSIPLLLDFSIYRSLTMFISYLITTLRAIKKNKGYSVINITGLALGMACFILILLWAKNELNYDRFHEQADQIYRVVTQIEYANGSSSDNIWNCTPMPLKSALQNDFPEVLYATRVDCSPGVVRYKNQTYFESELFLIDPEFFKIFSFPLLKGNAEVALKNPTSVILTPEIARKYFGNKNPLGRIMQINNRDHTVTGVALQAPQNSHIRFDFLLPYSSVLATSFGRGHWNNWTSIHGPTYILLKPGVDPRVVQLKLPAFFKKYAGEKSNYNLQIEPVTSIHLHGKHRGELSNNGDIQIVNIFAAAGLFILLIACFNYINLSTARSQKRAKEVGIRKVIGAGRRNLACQFFLESMLFVVIASILAIPCVLLLLPSFSNIVGRELNFELLMFSPNLFLFIGVILFVGLASGSYPSFFLSSLKPTKVMKGIGAGIGRRQFYLRNGLVIGQFVMSIALIICTLVVIRQLDFIRKKHLGFSQERILALTIRDQGLRKNLDAFKQALSKQSSIVDACYQNRLPSEIRHVGSFFLKGRSEDEVVKTYVTFVDYEYVNFYDMSIVEGRDFSKSMITDLNQAALVNQCAVKELGFKNPIGKQIKVWGRDLTIIGVVEDYHFLPLRQSIAPVTISLSKPSFLSRYGLRYGFLTIKISAQDIAKTLSMIEQEFKKFSPNYPFEFSFLDDRLDNIYVTDKQSKQAFFYFSIIAIIIACFGLFGLAAFSAEQRIKEFGVRKVLGASVPGLFYLISKELTSWVIISNVVAWPIAYFLMKNWLQDFAYRVHLGLWIFIISSGVGFGIALLTVSYQSLKAALVNPIECLRYE